MSAPSRLSSVDVDCCLQEEELRCQLLQVLQMVSERQEDYVNHAEFAATLHNTIKEISVRVESLADGVRDAACAKTSSSSTPPPHDYGVELDIAEPQHHHQNTHIDPTVELEHSPPQHFLSHFATFASRQPPKSQQQPQQKQKRRRRQPSLPPTAAALRSSGAVHDLRESSETTHPSTLSVLSFTQAPALSHDERTGASLRMQPPPSHDGHDPCTAASPSSSPAAAEGTKLRAQEKSASERAISPTSKGHEKKSGRTTSPADAEAAAAARASSFLRLKARSPPALKQQESGRHSPTHQSNSTSPFYMGTDFKNISSAGDDEHDGNNNNNSNNSDNRGGTTASSPRNAAAVVTVAGEEAGMEKENSFMVRQPSQTHLHDEEADVPHPSASTTTATATKSAAPAVGKSDRTMEGDDVSTMSPPTARLYPTNASLEEARLTAFEEEEPRGSGWGIPSVVVLRHRMGFSTVVLSAHQRATYSRFDLEKFILYKEQKYNAVNVLWRFGMLLMVILTFSIFCLVFSTCTTEWVGLQQTDNFVSMGLFVLCQNRNMRACESRASSRLQWTVVDSITGSTLCTASADFVHRFIGAMWAMAIVQLLCEFVALLLTAWILARPTRSGALVVLFFDLFLGTACGIIAVVLFHHYSSCLRRTCEGQHLSGRLCTVSWRYGYKLYLGALAVHGVLLLLALCMHSYIHNIRVTSRKQLREERHRASQRHADAEEYMIHVMDSSLAGTNSRGQGNANAEGGGEENTSTSEGRAFGFTSTRGGDDRNYEEGTETVETPFLGPSANPHDPLTQSSLHVSFVGGPSNRNNNNNTNAFQRNLTTNNSNSSYVKVTNVNPARRGQRAVTQRQMSPSSEQAALSRINNSIVSGRGDGLGNTVTNVSELTERTAGEAGGGPSRNNSFEYTQSKQRQGPQQGRRRGGSASRYPTGSPHQPQHHHVPSAKPRRRPSANTPAYQQARKRSRFFTRFFSREYDANYLTAAELGVPIDGASDWVYDDRSDMYYSFDRNMFWDPLTREYYNCALKTWQESPDQVVEVRDVLDYMLQDSEGIFAGTSSGDEASNEGNGGEARAQNAPMREGDASGEHENAERSSLFPHSAEDVDVDDVEEGQAAAAPGSDEVDQNSKTNAYHSSMKMPRRSNRQPQPEKKLSQQQEQHEHHGEPVTAASRTASAAADSSAPGGAARSGSSRQMHASEGTDGEEPVFAEQA